MATSLKSGQSLPNLYHIEKNSEEEMHKIKCSSQKSDVLKERRPQRVVRKTWKDKEELEYNFWLSVATAKTIIKGSKDAPVQHYVEAAQKCASDIERCYEEIRSSLPADIRQAGDRYIYRLKHFKADEDAHSQNSRSSKSTEHESSVKSSHRSNYSKSSSRKAELAAQLASMRAGIEARKLETPKSRISQNGRGRANETSKI